MRVHFRAQTGLPEAQTGEFQQRIIAGDALFKKAQDKGEPVHQRKAVTTPNLRTPRINENREAFRVRHIPALSLFSRLGRNVQMILRI
jgi:hypothetical protein